MVQFHFLFYASRTLPNTFALTMVLLAYRYWILGQHWKFLCLSGLAILVFRTELSLLLGLMLLGELLSGRLSLYTTVKMCLPAGAAILALTVVVDSFFWQYWLWPEGVVFWYNTILNKSSQWGTSPFLWYFYSALPRACLVALPLGVWGFLREPRIRGMVSSAFLFVLLYSFLPHKELRFIMYTIPIINVSAAAGAASLCMRHRKFQLPIRLLLVSSLIVSLAVSLWFLLVSAANYPGGVAMDTMHKMATKRDIQRGLSVHIDVEPAQTGVSRFTELHSNWRYLKTENLSPDSEELLAFDVLITSVGNEQYYTRTHEVVAIINGFAGFRNMDPFNLLNSLTKPTLVILRRM
jgi:alpha-1,6-mannosyltransferase